jgi:hypothetical protein
MIDLTISLTLDTGDQWTVKPSIGTYVKFERHFKKPITSLGSEIALEHLVWLGWEQSRHEGRAVAVFDKFIDQVENLEMVSDDNPLPETALPTM